MNIRKIIHLDLDAFFCAVEELVRPELAGKPFAVGGRPNERGVVASCSYPARQFGVRSAMPMARAVRVCPELIILPARHRRYGQVSSEVMALLRDLTPWVEQISIDEAFLDVSDLPDAPEMIARRLQTEIREKLHLPCSLGAATNKLVAKIANDFGKASASKAGPPNAVTIVQPGEEAQFLSPLPVEALWGVGPKTAERMESLGILTIGDLSQKPVAELVRLFGKTGYDLAQHAIGVDHRPVLTSHEVKSISQETTFVRDVRDEILLRRTITQLSQTVGERLRRTGLYGSTVKIKLRWADFTTLTRQVTLEKSTDDSEQIQKSALQLFEQNWSLGQAVRLIGVGISNLGAPPKQLSLWDGAKTEKEQRLHTAIDALRDRFGADTVHRGYKTDAKSDD